MFFRESIWWLVGTGIIGLLLGYAKGMPRLGFLLGAFLGPIGWGIVVMLPSQRKQGPSGPQPFGQGEYSGAGTSGSSCPRCGRPVSRNDKACSGCGNVLMQVKYKVHDTPENQDENK